MVIVVWVQNIWRMFFDWCMISKDVISMHLSVDPIMILDKTKLIHVWEFSWITISYYCQRGIIYIYSWFFFFFVIGGMFSIFACNCLPKGGCCMFGLRVKNGWSYWEMHQVEGFVYLKGTIFWILCILMD